MIPPRLLLLLLALGFLLTVTVVPSAFTIDEPDHLMTVVALRHGSLTIPGTAGLPPSRELLFFDPSGLSRQVTTTPVASTAPPLYAPIALPFSYLGWRGLVALNTLAFLVTGLLVFRYARDHSTEPRIAWLAVGTYLLGGYSIEYAQGLWPHMLSVAVTTGAAYLASRVRSGAPAVTALGAGLLAGLATGIRYQNLVVASALGLGLLLWAPRRVSAAWRFALGVGLPLALAGAMNHVRLGSWNPVSKGPGYLSVDLSSRTAGAPLGGLGSHLGALGRFLGDTAVMFWARVVDYAAAPPLPGTVHWSYLRPDPVTGAYMINDTLKKAWLQSAPWMLLPLALLLIAWVSSAGFRPELRREMRAVSLVVLGVLLALAASGPYRTDGLNFNQRYLLELVPLMAVVFAWSLESVRLERLPLFGGFLSVGVLMPLIVYRGAPVLRQYSEMVLPLALAVLLTGAWILARRRRADALTAVLVGLCVGWAFFIHLTEDLRGSRELRTLHLIRFQAIDLLIPDRSALFASGLEKNAAAALQLDRNVVIVNPSVDEGRDASALAAALLGQGRPLFVAAGGMRRSLFEAIRGGRPVRILLTSPLLLVEISPRTAP